MVHQDSKNALSVISIFLLIVISILFQACSSTLDSSIEDKEIEAEKVSFQVLAKDGVISNALVYFCSLNKGVIKGPFSTSFDGVAKPSFDKSVLESLEEDDQLYWWITSTSSTTVTVDRTNPRIKAVSPGQVSLKSYLGRAVLIRSKAAINPDLSQDSEILSKSTVTHFSNARANLFEARLLKSGLISSRVNQEAPSIQFTESKLKNITQFAEQLDERYSKSNSATAHKLKLMAAMTKAIIEYDVSRLLDGTTDQGLSNSASVLFQVAENNFREVSSEFLTVFDNLYVQLEQDLLDSDIRKSIGDDSIVVSMQSISKNQTRLAVASDLDDDIPRLSVEDITPIPSNSLSVKSPGEVAQGSLFATPRYGVAKGQFIFQP